jgi:hypothetical protein
VAIGVLDAEGSAVPLGVRRCGGVRLVLLEKLPQRNEQKIAPPRSRSEPVDTCQFVRDRPADEASRHDRCRRDDELPANATLR